MSDGEKWSEQDVRVLQGAAAAAAAAAAASDNTEQREGEDATVARSRLWEAAGTVTIDGATGPKAYLVNGVFEVAERPEGEPPIYRHISYGILVMAY